MVDPARTGYVDESYGRDPDDRLVYVLGLAVPTGPPDDLRAALRDLTRTRGGAVHFADEDESRRIALAKAIGALDLDLTAVVRRGRADSAARARAVCLTTLGWVAHDRVDQLVLEARGPKPDRADSELLSRLHPAAHRLPTEFLGKRADPLLWAADVLAGAVFRAVGRGLPDCLAAIGPVTIERC